MPQGCGDKRNLRRTPFPKTFIRSAVKRESNQNIIKTAETDEFQQSFLVFRSIKLTEVAHLTIEECRYAFRRGASAAPFFKGGLRGSGHGRKP